jgi:hypothetical protein
MSVPLCCPMTIVGGAVLYALIRLKALRAGCYIEPAEMQVSAAITNAVPTDQLAETSD